MRLRPDDEDGVAAQRLAAGFLDEARGITVLLGADTAAVEGDGCVEAIRLADGRELPCDIVVSAVGIRPNATLARDFEEPNTLSTAMRTLS